MKKLKVASKFIVVGILVVLFNNCGQGFKSLRVESINQSSQLTPTPFPTSTPVPSSTPRPSPTSTPIHTPTPVPTPTATPAPTATPRPTATVPPPPPPNPDMLPTKPSWYDGLPSGAWTAIGTNTVLNVQFAPDDTYPYNTTNGSFANIMGSWNGGIFARRMGNSGTLLIYGGGHKNYWGNDTYGFDLESRTWKLISKPYLGPINFDLPDGLFPDGTPGPMHTYNRVQYDPVGNNFWIFGRERNDNGGSTDHYFSYLNLAQPQLTNRANWTNLPPSVSNMAHTGHNSCYDEATRAFWIFGSGKGLTKFNIETKTATNYNNGQNDGYYGTADCTMGLYIYTSQSTGTIRARDLSAPTQNSIVLATVSVASNPGFSWSNARQAFIYWNEGSPVSEFKYLGGNAKSASSWSFDNLGITGSGANIPTKTPNGTFGRFRVVQFKDGSEMAIVVNTTGGKVHVFKMP